ncbi:MAG: tetratricopeptide repeat protein [Bacteroidales bacterium]|nr:tetratricopeptide repeat protein [Bacteroidales bacterium]
MKKILAYALAGCCLLAVAWVGLSKFRASAMDYAQYAQERSRQSMAQLKAEGRRHIENEEPDSAIACYSLMEARMEGKLTRPDYEMALDAQNNLGYVYQYFRCDFALAFDYYIRALEESERIGYAELQPCLHLNIGNIYSYFEEIEKAVEEYKLAIEKAVEYDRPEILLITVHNMISDYIAYGDFGEPQSAIDRYKSYRMPAGVELSRFVSNFVAGFEAYRKGDYDEAYQGFERAKNDIDTRIRPRSYHTSASIAMAKSCAKMGKYDKALELLSSAFDGIEPEDNDIRIDIYSNLARCYDEMGDEQNAEHAWYHYYKISYEVFNAYTGVRVQDVLTRQQIERQNAATRALIQRQRTYAIVSIVVGCGLLIIIMLLVWLYRKGKREKQLMEDLYRRAIAQMQLMPALQAAPQHVVQEVEAVPVGADEPAPAPPAETDQLTEVYNHVQHIMATSQEVFDPGFSLGRVSDMVGEHPRRVSQAINEVGGKNFSMLLAEARIREACRRMADTDAYGKYTIGAIAESVGFQSRTNFTSVFKKVTGLTPSEFQNMARKQAVG